MFQKILIWFVQKAWPIILKFLIRYGEEIIAIIVTLLTKQYNERQTQKAKENYEKATEYHNHARSSSTDEERKEYEFKSDFFKQQAEECANDIKKMAEIFENATKKTTEFVREKTKEFKAEDIFKIEENEFEVKPNNNYLGIKKPN
ncbi:hypothetical protein PY093_18815 [Cytobacillus sp. S13-E01]|uniref:hypothetical protein n=1 Tax=Cytobacillus sp. S13-E01 TaxID=3031326 RepID=UPI0023D84E74|nr:hypothetical protein [Cytobacillus sp. S13-E01]MDF0728681.1 hypothetical protein [Cytobacillus sp. S13-E01]